MIRTSWCGQVAAPNASRTLALSRRLGARPSSPPMMNTAAGRPSSRQRPSRDASVALSRLSPRCVEDEGDGLVGDDIGQRDRFFDHPLADLLGAAFADFHNFHVAKADAPAGLLGALAIALGELALGAILEPADGGNHQPHFI